MDLGAVWALLPPPPPLAVPPGGSTGSYLGQQPITGAGAGTL